MTVFQAAAVNRATASRRALLIASWLAFAGCQQEDQLPRPNVVLVTIDALRADKVSAYGGPEGLTPHIDSLARQGVLFEHALAPIATTFPSHATMLTGLYPIRHGVRYNGMNLAPEFRTVPQLLEPEGYDSAAFVSYRAMLSRAGLSRGFATLSDEVGTKVGKAIIRDGEETMSMAIDWLSRRQSESPFLLWIHLFEPHTPYEVTEYSEAELADYRGFARRGLDASELLRNRAKFRRNPDDLRALNVLYEGEVKAADSLVGRLLSALERTGELSRSVVVVTSDHGEGMGEQGRFGHGPVLFDSILRVPLVIRDFRRRSDPIRIRETVGLVDLADTLMDLLGSEERLSTHGRSLAPALRGEELERVPYFVEVRSRDVRRAGFEYDPDAVGVYLGSLKLVDSTAGTLLYDLEASPEEAQPADIAANAEIVAALSSRISDFRTGASAARPTELDEETLEELRSLGYIQ